MRFHTLRVAAGLFVSLVFTAAGTVRYVDITSLTPTPPYTNWATAANVIQDAVEAADPGDQVWVTNGVYDTGGRAVYQNMTNRVAVVKPLTLLSVNGPEFTIIRGAKAAGGGNGDGAIRCVYLTNGAILSGFTLTNGATRAVFDSTTHQSGGGGLWCETTGAWVSNCVLSGNISYHWGAGSVRGTLYDSVLKNNSTGAGGGGAASSILLNCTLTGNSANVGGGAWSSMLTNCVLLGNSANSGGGGAYGALQNCTLTGNISSGDGGGADGSVLNDCTLVGNFASQSGGGASDGTLTRCLIVSNSASSGGGGGAIRNTQYLQNCVLIGNRASFDGGGSAGGRLGNCTVVGNSAGNGGGVSSSTLSNCIVYSNIATNAGNNHWNCTLNYSCTLPMPTNGIGNISNAPLFVDVNGWGNLRSQSNSPCINAGRNAYVTSATDLDGNPRIQGGTVDIGAYEFQNPTSVISYAWLQQYDLLTDGSADSADPDGDGMKNWQEWIAGTDPTNALSVFQMLTPLNALSGVTVSWQSVAGTTYYLQRSTNLSVQPTFLSQQSNIVGQAGTTTYTDTNALGGGPYFYRVGLLH